MVLAASCPFRIGLSRMDAGGRQVPSTTIAAVNVPRSSRLSTSKLGHRLTDGPSEGISTEGVRKQASTLSLQYTSA